MPEKNNTMLLNDIVYKIHTIQDFDEMRRSVLDSLQFLIPSALSTFYLSSASSPYELCRPIGRGVSEDRLMVYLRDYQELDYTRWTFAAPIGQAFRETDLMTDTARENTPYYKEMFKAGNIHYSAILTIIFDGVFLGVINLFRSKDDQDFSDDEMFFLDLLKEHLGYRLSQEFSKFKEKAKVYPTKDSLMSSYQLTTREVEIVYLLLDGLSRQMICEKLCITLNTLKKHTVNIYKKLEINSWRELFKLIK